MALKSNLGLLYEKAPEINFVTSSLAPNLLVSKVNEIENKNTFAYSIGVNLSYKITKRFDIKLNVDYLSTISKQKISYTSRSIIDLNSNDQIELNELIESQETTFRTSIRRPILFTGLGLKYHIFKPKKPIILYDTPRPINENEIAQDPCECGFEVFLNSDRNYQLRFNASCRKIANQSQLMIPNQLIYYKIVNGNIISFRNIDLSISPDFQWGSASRRNYVFGTLPDLLGPNTITYRLVAYANVNPGRIKACECEQEFKDFPIPHISSMGTKDQRAKKIRN